jgi:hypothetical protein
VFPVWLSFYRGRGAGRFASSFVLAAGISLAAIACVLLIREELQTHLRSVWQLADWQAWKAPMTDSFWLGIPWAYRLPVFVVYFAFVITTAFWPMPRNLAHVLALSAAALIGIQFWYADQGGVYVLWYLPLLLLLVFRPNLADRQPPALPPESGRVATASQAVVRAAIRIVRGPEPLTRVH